MEEGEDSRLLCAMEVGGVSLSFGCVFSTLFTKEDVLDVQLIDKPKPDRAIDRTVHIVANFTVGLKVLS